MVMTKRALKRWRQRLSSCQQQADFRPLADCEAHPGFFKKLFMSGVKNGDTMQN
jgi:hypothetical protein